MNICLFISFLAYFVNGEKVHFCDIVSILISFGGVLAITYGDAPAVPTPGGAEAA